MNPPRWSSKCTWAHIFWHFIFLSSFVFKKENKGEDYYSQTLQNFGVAKGWMRGKVYVCVHRHVWACMHVRYVRQERTIVFVYEVVSLFPVASPFMILLLIKTILLRSLPTRRLQTASDTALGGPSVLCWLTIRKKSVTGFLLFQCKYLFLPQIHFRGW